MTIKSYCILKNHIQFIGKKKKENSVYVSLPECKRLKNIPLKMSTSVISRSL